MSGSFSRSTRTRKPGVTATSSGVVAAQHVRAAEVGAEVLAAGGDAVDAAVAVSFAIGVLEPWMSGPMGGGAMMLWRADDDRAHALNYGMRSSATLDVGHYPLAGTGKASDLFPWEAVVEDRNVTGASSVAVPGTMAGISAAHGRFGRMPWSDLLAPAVDLARAGLHVDWYAALVIASSARDLARDPDAAALFLDDGQWPKGSGWTALADQRLDQSKMADTLDLLSREGEAAFYRGEIAEALVRDVTDKGGFLSMQDMRDYAPVWSDPLAIPFRDATIHAVPGLTAGPTLADALYRWQSGYVSTDAATPAAFVARADGLRAAYVDRLSNMGDHESAKAPGCTTHFSIVDRNGNMVAMTQTLLSIFGAKVVSPSTGLMLNNGIMWFDPEPGKPNSLAPDKACLMNVCPVIGETPTRRFALGASGGRKIMPAVAQISGHLVEQGLSMQEAIEAPRIDASGGAQVVADERLAGPVTDALAKRFPTALAQRLPFPFAFACPAGVMREGTTNSGTTETMSPWGDGVAEPDTKAQE
ncbi:gamma-glutamyltransferase [Sagittula stellata]|uniref:Possible gamma-glutamyltranspeptidase n=1 Tax=Sagittula stellata (strain ATCC 700073 / DSM 11524 / E-37) TaxID=388399 RepID=A3K385_SAGS3|nr:gamma-glutamyltransferase [Sagittula stellata]EBA08644.1 possible gamma-glutamyltranspeptidase precursor [Sagittula stellata E-37]